ncbi:Oxo-4-hydroxy-4-carboxy-5-ureidoimidazoline decarboxylase [Cladorrhinum samala]|uniref:Oxo-4-hydroxy-4-carboxy-5-ureidoimidazoline decarboxylase n=1 Tax=Cladorrhinum samala TaxID=585594 RepID=A0AAV9HT43_9PEZI|nr:Oxo-4-hydroxy-4-carboxy-5-ureidoimidazoline decarboxylase [Cladorrhinum samala]
MSTLNLPPIESLPSLPDSSITAALDLLFEPSADLHALVLPSIKSSSFTSYDALISQAGAKLLDLANAANLAALDAHNDNKDLPEERQKLHGILGAHPRLGAAKPATVATARQGKGEGEEEEEELSEQSKAEQKQLRGGDPGEAEKLRKLNDEYEAKFPGLRYVVWVNGRGRPEIMADMRRRIDSGDIRGEERAAIQAMCDIARDRAGKLLKAAEGRQE